MRDKESSPTNKTTQNPMGEIATGKLRTTPKSVCGNADEEISTKTSQQEGVTNEGE